MTRLFCQLPVLIFICLIASSLVHAKNSEQQKADQARRADSIRVADSVRAAESQHMSAYDAFDRQHTIETSKQPEQTGAAAQESPAGAEESGGGSSTREISVSPDQERRVDSLDKEIAALDNKIFSDRQFKRAKGKSAQDQVAILKHLLSTKMKTKAEVAGLAQGLLQLSTEQQQKLEIILESQTGDSRRRVMLNLTKLRRETQPLSDFAVRIANN